MRQFQPQQILRELIQILKTNRGIFSRNTWQPLADPLFNCLRRLGRKAGYTVWKRKKGGEYLWDIVWSHEPKSAKQYWLELVGEIELTEQNLTALRDDFYKVLDANARLKVFVCAPPARKWVKWICDEIDWAVAHQRFRLHKERFIAIILDYDGRTKTYVNKARLFDGFGPIGKWSKRWEVIKFKY